MRLSRLLPAILLLSSSLMTAQSSSMHPAAATPAHPHLAATAPAGATEQHAAAALESIKNSPLALYDFLREMPKGGDLHNHMTGAVYAESYAKWAAEKNLCVDRKTLALSEPPPCKAGQVAAKDSLTDPVLYRDMLANWSMLGWPMSGKSGHDHFFDTFLKFDPAGAGHYGEMLAELSNRAADANEQYLELMLSPDEFASLGIGAKFDTAFNQAAPTNWDRIRKDMLAGGIRDLVTQSRKNLDTWEARRTNLQHCRAENKAMVQPGCDVKVRYIFQVLRGFTPAQVFAQTLTAFELASQDSRVVALNLVMPEDALVPMRDFRMHMQMISFLKEMYPDVHITLHAGELAPGLVPPDGLRFHIRESVEMAHAERIGHGVDVMYEDDPTALLADLAHRNIMVEICLTSNDVILGVRGKSHPLWSYIKAGVPVALATDDEGVSRSEITREFQKGVTEQDLDYFTLKRMVRTSIEHAFLPGASLWRDSRNFLVNKECAMDHPGAKTPTAACAKFLEGSEKAREQWKLEQRFAEFEAKY